MSVDQILDTESNELQEKYDTALETRQRTDGDIFWRDLDMLTKLSRHYQDMIRLDKEYRSAESAILTNIAAAAREILNSVLGPDLITMFGFLVDYLDAYDKIYSDTTALMQTYTELLTLNILEVEQLLYLTWRSGSVHSKLLDKATQGTEQIQFLREALDIINLQYQNTTSAVEVDKDLLENLPLKFYKDPLQCQSHIISLRKSLDNLAILFQDIIRNARQSYIKKLQEKRLDLKKDMSSYSTVSDKVLACLREYQSALQVTYEWGMKVRLDINSSQSDYKLDINSVQDIAKDLQTHSAVITSEMSK